MFTKGFVNWCNNIKLTKRKSNKSESTIICPRTFQSIMVLLKKFLYIYLYIYFFLARYMFINIQETLKYKLFANYKMLLFKQYCKRFSRNHCLKNA